MRKSTLFSMVLLTALCGCTVDNVDNKENNDNVEIRFGAGVSVGVDAQVKPASRAPLTGWDNTQVGMFVLAKNVDADYASQTRRDVLWNNVQATIASGGKATPTLAGQPKYYPNGGDREFSFYGYHPFDGTSVEPTAKEITRTFTITRGEKDILWGKAEVEGGYNAPYFRQHTEEVPNVRFNHLLSQLVFKVKASENFEEGQSLSVTKLEIVEVPTSLTLNIVAGTLAPGEANQTITVYNDDRGTSIEHETGETPLGSAVMLYSSNSSQKYKIVLTTKDPEGNESTTQPIEISPAQSANFEVGKAYNVILSLNSYKEIEFEATWTDWVSGEDVNVEI